MKKTLAAILIVGMAFILPLSALADGTTTLTTTVPDATYTLNIPADQEILFGTTSTDIGDVTVTNSSGFAEGKNLKVTVSYTPFQAEKISTDIPMQIHQKFTIERLGYPNSYASRPLNSGSSLEFAGKSNGNVEAIFEDVTSNGRVIDRQLQVRVSSEDWGKALGGDYSSTITFTSEVVSAATAG